jgi:hypothetical protein
METKLSELQDDEDELYIGIFSGGTLKLLPASAQVFKLFPHDNIA